MRSATTVCVCSGSPLGISRPSMLLSHEHRLRFHPVVFCVFLTSLVNTLSFALFCSMQLDVGVGGEIKCQGFGSSINRLWKRAELASTHSSPCVTVADATTPTGKKSKRGWRGVGVGGCNGNCPLFLTLVRKPSLLLRGEWHLLITIEALWEVPPFHTGAAICPIPQ